MDAFYAVRAVAYKNMSCSSIQNVELLDNPELAGKPFGVSHPVVSYALRPDYQKVGRGVLTTASYEARKYGVRSGMAGMLNRECLFNSEILSNSVARFRCEKALSRSHSCFKPIPQVHGDVKEGFGYLPPV